MLNLTPRFDPTLPLPTLLQPIAKNSTTLARLLAGRGVTDVENLNTALSAMLPAQGLMGIEKAVVLLDNAIDNGQKILIVGDFDFGFFFDQFFTFTFDFIKVDIWVK